MIARIVIGGLAAALVLATPLAAQEQRVPRQPVAANRAEPTPLQPCPSYGAGFVRVPGSTTCLRLSGRVRAGADAGSAPARLAPVEPPVSGRFSIDTRSDTDYGPVRTFVRAGNGQP
ncbi:porin [Methylobacterium sp. A54F]